MKGICLAWSRGRHFSPSLPGDRYLKLGSKSDLRAEISGSIVWYNALALRPEVLRSCHSVCACALLLELKVQLFRISGLESGPKSFRDFQEMGPRFFNVKIKLYSFVDASTNDFGPRIATIIEPIFFSFFTCFHTNT